MSPSTVNTILQKIDGFIRRYYLNRLIKGGIYTAALCLSLFLLVSALEYFGNFDSSIRTFLFFSFLIIVALVLVRFVVFPLTQLYKLGKIISHEQAALIIGNHFKGIEDKILNVLLLNKELSQVGDSSLLEAAIDQKAKELSPLPFVNAVNLAENKRYLKYALIPAGVLVLILLFYPNLVTQSTNRLIKYNQAFEPVAPFVFVVENQDLASYQNEDFEVKLKLEGNTLPAEVFLEDDKFEYRLNKLDDTHFSFVFNNLQKNKTFRFTAAGFNSKDFLLKVLVKPAITSFALKLNYPAYTGKSNETLQNIGDITVPEGTKAEWLVNGKNVSDFRFLSSLPAHQNLAKTEKNGENNFKISAVLLQSFSYAFGFGANKSAQPLSYSATIITDRLPEIAMQERKDSTSAKRLYFIGQVKDDYGFSKLTFNYKVTRSDSGAINGGGFVVQSLPVDKAQTTSNFFHYWDLNTLSLTPGTEIEYFFEIWDNDGVHGAKSSRTGTLTYKAPGLEELSQAKESDNKEIKKDLERAITSAKKLQKEINSLNKKMLDKKNLSWEDKKQMENLLEQQKELQKQIEKVSDKQQQSNQQQNEFLQPDPELLEKQKQLEEIFDKVMTDEMKEMFRQMEQMLEKFDKNQAQEMLEKMKLSSKDLEKELDKNLELFKQLEFEQKLTETTDKLKDLARKQDELSKETENTKKPTEEQQQKLADKQEELTKQFETVKKELEDLEKKNQELEKPHEDFKHDEKKENDIEKNQKESEQELKEKNNKKAAQKQKQAAEQMQEMAQQMEKMQEQMEQEEAAEDYDALRQILENLLQLSFNQEKLITDLKKLDPNNPQYLKVGQTQLKLMDDSKMIEDSLFALSKRNPQIESVVNKEIAAINDNMKKALEHLEERQVGQASSRQQFAMTSINNLALILSESLQQMQQQMKNQQSKSGKGGSCKKPGKGDSPSMSSMRQMQQQLNEQLKKMKEGMNKGGQKPGQQGQGSSGMSQELAKMAAQQQALRQAMQQALQQMQGEQGKESGGSSGNAKELKELAKKMEQTEKDIVNKNITTETLKRQQEILTRLLEAEKAERERDQDEKRKSNEAKKQDFSNPELFLEYNRLKKKEAELLKTVPPNLKTFYKTKVNEYFNSVNGLN